MKKKLLISVLVLMVIVSLAMIASFTVISAEEVTELPKAENLTVEAFRKACTGEENFDVILGKTTNAQVVRELLTAKGLSPNVLLKDPGENRTDKEDHYEPLVYVAASYTRDPDVIKTLLELGADFNINNGRSLIFAVVGSVDYDNQGKILSMLLNAGVNVNAQDEKGETALMKAVGHAGALMPGSKKIIEILIDAGADVNLQSNYGETALFVAATANNKELFDMLVKAGADISIKNKNGETASEVFESMQRLHDEGMKGFAKTLEEQGLSTTADYAFSWSFHSWNIEEIKRLLKEGANPNLRTYSGKPFLIEAAENAPNPQSIILALIEASADVNATDNEGNTTLIALIKNYKPERYVFPMYFSSTINSLIEAGVDVNAQNNDGMTALMYATNADVHPVAILTLLSAGANPDVKAKDGTVAKLEPQKLMEAFRDIVSNPFVGNLGSSTNYARITKELIRAGLDINARDKDGWPLLLRAVANGDMNVRAVKGLIEGGANVNVTGGKSNITPIMQAVMGNSVNVIQVLAESGANLEVRDSDGETPLFLAIRNGSFMTVNTLVRNGANVNARSNDGTTALILASINDKAKRKPEILKSLLHAGANINARDNELGATALIVASAIGDNPEIIRALLEAGADPNLTSNEGGRAIDYVRANEKLNRTEAVDMLINAMNPSNRFNSSQTAPRSNSSSAANIDVFKLAATGTLQELQDAAAKGAKFDVEKNGDNGDDTELFFIGETPLHIAAAFNQNPGVIKFLVSQGIDVDTTAADGEMGSSHRGNPLSCAIRHKNINAVRELLTAGADPNSYSNDSGPYVNPISKVALEYDDDAIAQLVLKALLEAGSNVNDEGGKDEIPAEFKKSYLLPRNQWSSSDFRENMTDVSNVDLSYFYGSSTPLMYAVLLGKTNIANTLLDFNANANIYNAENKLALDYANEAPDYSTIKNSPVFNRLKNATTVASKAIKSDPNFDRADMLVAQGKIPMYVRDKGKFVYNPQMKMVRVMGKNVRLRSQPNVKANVIDRSNYGEWGTIEYLGEWTHPSGEKWIVGIYDDWNNFPEPTAEWEKKVIWVSAKYARPVTMEEYRNWQSTIERAE